MIWEISPRFLFPNLTYDDFEPHRDWLVPHFSTEELKLRLSIHSFVIRTPHHTVVVDTCIGNDRKRDVPLWDHMQSDYLERFAAAGLSRSASRRTITRLRASKGMSASRSARART